MPATAEAKKVSPKDYKSHIPPDWCPGCGDFGVLAALQKACAELAIPHHELMVVSGIGCSSNLPGFFRSYGVHSLHGRSIPVASGIKFGNHSLTVVATGGDGDGYGIGVGHFVHAMRRNIDITYIVMNNEIYGLTTGQVSPTSEHGAKTKSTPFGNLEVHLNPVLLALASGCGYVARGFSGDQKQLVELYKGGIRHRGFALIDVFSPCVTFNKVNTYQWFRERVTRLEGAGHDSSDFTAAVEQARKWGDEIPIGLFYRDPDPRSSIDNLDPALQGPPLAELEDIGLTLEQRRGLLQQLM